MIYRSAANCRFCVHYLGDRKCQAFPDEIPEALWTGEQLHREPAPGDHGVLFERKPIEMPDAETFLSWADNS